MVYGLRSKFGNQEMRMSSPNTLENVLYEKKDGIAYVTVNRPTSPDSGH